VFATVGVVGAMQKGLTITTDTQHREFCYGFDRGGVFRVVLGVAVFALIGYVSRFVCFWGASTYFADAGFSVWVGSRSLHALGTQYRYVSMFFFSTLCEHLILQYKIIEVFQNN
jgi:hypothetical protein